mmetsp:Transcript_80315/g.141741  ORF Transcript_80315/g.141741 Transcript_80315/m.141741 type:complete len:201 (+) Transcript_80315:190-792(+)
MPRSASPTTGLSLAPAGLQLLSSSPSLLQTNLCQAASPATLQNFTGQGTLALQHSCLSSLPLLLSQIHILHSFAFRSIQLLQVFLERSALLQQKPCMISSCLPHFFPCRSKLRFSCQQLLFQPGQSRLYEMRWERLLVESPAVIELQSKGTASLLHSSLGFSKLLQGLLATSLLSLQASHVRGLALFLLLSFMPMAGSHH